MNTRLKRNIKIFGKSQINAGLATAIDFVVLIFLTEILSLWYLISAAFGAIGGGIANYALNRKWAFKSNGRISSESARYLAVSGMSLFWNCLLIWVATDMLGFQYIVSKAIVSIIIALCWNFPLHKKWVFVATKVSRELLQEESSQAGFISSLQEDPK